MKKWWKIQLNLIPSFDRVVGRKNAYLFLLKHPGRINFVQFRCEDHEGYHHAMVNDVLR
jgi:hypothetical protein